MEVIKEDNEELQESKKSQFWKW